jgi:hypothetical protein
MTDQERDLITRFIERVAGAQTPGHPLPPIDPEADRLLADLYTRFPEARYRITQMAMVQEQALMEAQNRITRLQWEVQNARQAQAAPPQPGGSPWGAAAPQPPQSRGFFSGLFGGGAAAPRPAAPPPQYAPPPPQYAPGYNPGMFPQQGSGFLGSALRTAAGVAGGVVAADALMNLFSGRREGGGWGAEAATPGTEAGFANPWGGGQGDAGDWGGAAKQPVADDKFAGPAQIDQADWQQGPGQGGGWQDASADPGYDQGNTDQSGWDQASDDTGGGWDDDIQNT